MRACSGVPLGVIPVKSFIDGKARSAAASRDASCETAAGIGRAAKLHAPSAMARATSAILEGTGVEGNRRDVFKAAPFFEGFWPDMSTRRARLLPGSRGARPPAGDRADHPAIGRIRIDAL